MNPGYTDVPRGQGDSILTPIDVDRLLSDDSPDSRTGILDKVSASYNKEEFKGRERDIAEQIFRLLMKDAVLRVRETLADRIKDNVAVPRDIVLHLAHDVESVAAPVLVNSKVLSDADLVSIVEQSQGQDMGKLLAITRRDHVSDRVTEALVDTHYAPVMTSLLSNDGAVISDRSLEKIAEDFRGHQEVIEALSIKPKLPITVVERIITQVSSAVSQQLKEKYKLTDREVVPDSKQIREDFMLRLLGHDLTQGEVEDLVRQMASEDRLTPSIVMTALCRGQLMFFTVAMAHFAGISVANAMRLVADRGEHGFDGIYQKSGLPDTMMDAIRLLLRAVQDMQNDPSIPGSMLYANRLAEQVILAAGSRQIDYLPYFIALIRQNQHR